MQAYLYRWKLVVGREDEFVDAWSAVTTTLRSHGGLGSRLHRGDDGWWYGYAQWPDAATRDRAFARARAVEGHVGHVTKMRSLVVEASPEVALEPRADLLEPVR